MSAAHSARRGVALLAALVIVALIALLVSGALSVAMLAQRSVQASGEGASLAAGADDAAHAVLSGASVATLGDLPIGQALVSSIALGQTPPVNATVTTTRLPNDVLWIVADAELSGRDAGRRRVNVVARWRVLVPVPSSPLVARGPVRLRGGLLITGDSATDAECAMPSFAGVAVAPGAAVVGGDSVGMTSDPANGDSAHYAQAEWQRRAVDAGSGAIGGAIHVRADTVISNSSFHGVMIADGSVSIVGPFTAEGLIIARGPITVNTNELLLTGAMLSFANPPAGQFAIDVGGGVVHFSPCVVARALRRIASLRVVQQRNWSEIF
jgi:hypothetical protein